MEVYELDDNTFEIEAQLVDVKPFDATLSQGVRPAGEPIHNMWMRLRFDSSFNVLGCQTLSESVPYAGFCESINPAYARLEGANLLKGFRQVVKERLGGTAGCTHMSELAGVLPTAAVQAMAGKMRRADPEKRPFQLDRCHALAAEGAAVALFYPQWHKKKPAASA